MKYIKVSSSLVISVARTGLFYFVFSPPPASRRATAKREEMGAPGGTSHAAWTAWEGIYDILLDKRNTSRPVQWCAFLVPQTREIGGAAPARAHISACGERAGGPSDSFQAEISTPAAGNGAHHVQDPAGWFLPLRSDPQPTQESQP
jgi:hypothetical protein